MTWKLKCITNLTIAGTTRYPATSVVDVDAIKQKLVSGEAGQLEGGRAGRMDAEKTRIKEDYTLIKILAAILSALLVIVTVFVVCCCCPSMSPVLATCHVSRVSAPCCRVPLLPRHQPQQGGARHRGGHPGAHCPGRRGQAAAGRQVRGDPQVSQVQDPLSHGQLETGGNSDRCPVTLHCPCRAEGAGSAGGRRGPGTGGGGGGCPCPAWTTST